MMAMLNSGETGGWRSVGKQSASKAIDLGEITATATVIARHIGKKPPELTVTEARGIGKDVKLSDFKGRWLLIEFWGYW